MIPTWAERCKKFGDEIVTNAMIQRVMQEEIDELRSKVDKMQDDIVSLTDDLFSEGRECLRLEEELALQKLSDISQAIKQEPVAWKVDQLVFSALSSAEHHADIVEEPIVPLYTQPMRELTDEEIDEVWVEDWRLSCFIGAKKCNYVQY
jgi:hypothetical protein